MPRPLDWQASEDVAKILDHNSILLIPAREVGGWVPEPQDEAAVGPVGTQQLLPYMAWHPPSTWGVEVVDVET